MTDQDRHDVLLGLAEAIRGTRRHRARIFGEIPLGNPLWDVMLDLYIRDLNGYRTPIEQQLADSEFPGSALDRSLKALSSHGLVTLTVDPLSQHEILVSLSERGREGMSEVLREAAELLGLHPSGEAAADTVAG